MALVVDIVFEIAAPAIGTTEFFVFWYLFVNAENYFEPRVVKLEQY